MPDQNEPLDGAGLINALEAACSRAFEVSMCWDNPWCAEQYAEAAEAMGYPAQQVCDSAGSTGAYYEVWALYQRGQREERGGIFAAQPLVLVFDDFSRSTICTWLAPVRPWGRGGDSEQIAPDPTSEMSS